MFAGDLFQGSPPTGYVARYDDAMNLVRAVDVVDAFISAFVTVLASGEVAVALESASGGFGFIYDADLLATPVRFDLTAAPRGVSPMGSELLVAGVDRFRRLTRGGALVETTLVPAGWTVEASVGVAGARAAALVPPGGVGERALGRFSPRGELACEAQGVCGPVSCDDGESCTLELCDRAGGTCATTPVAPGQTCGPAQSCSAAEVCGP